MWFHDLSFQSILPLTRYFCATHHYCSLKHLNLLYGIQVSTLLYLLYSLKLMRTIFFFHSLGPKLVVRTEEVLIVVLVLILWVAAIALFFNRWGKIRMLEPYQPKFQQQHRTSCPLVELDVTPTRTQVIKKIKLIN